MLDANKQRDEIISHLESARDIANELAETTLAFMIERAIDEARSPFSAANGTWSRIYPQR